MLLAIFTYFDNLNSFILSANSCSNVSSAGPVYISGKRQQGPVLVIQIFKSALLFPINYAILPF